MFYKPSSEHKVKHFERMMNKRSLSTNSKINVKFINLRWLQKINEIYLIENYYHFLFSQYLKYTVASLFNTFYGSCTRESDFAVISVFL
jgi:hypothetical protein